MRTLQSVLLVFLALQPSPCTCEVNTTWMKDVLTQHFSQARHHVTNPQYKQQAMMFIRDQFQDMGLDVHLQNFSTDLSSVTGINVIGVLRGRYFNTSDDRVVGIGAHYDTMRNTPGVNDNGAAVVVMLQAARELSRQPNRRHTILFIAFDFEEWEPQAEPQVACGRLSCGSVSLVNEWLPTFLSAPSTWQGIFIMDTIMNFNEQQGSQQLPVGFDMLYPNQAQSVTSDGRQGDFLLIAGRGDDQSLQGNFTASWNSLGQPQYELEAFTVSPLASDLYRSDHASFWRNGYTALFLTDSANFRGYMTQCYHAECDTIQHVTPSVINFTAKTCRALINTVDILSPVIKDTSSAANRCQARAGWTMGLAAMMIMFWRNNRF